jgi:hypothetical protein
MFAPITGLACRSSLSPCLHGRRLRGETFTATSPHHPLHPAERTKPHPSRNTKPSYPATACSRSPSARRTRASSWGPFAAVRRGRQARRGIDTDVDAFSPGQDALSKSPAPSHALVGQDARRARYRGGLLFGYFLLAKQEKVTRTPAGVRNTPQATTSRKTTNERKARLSPTLSQGRMPEERGIGVAFSLATFSSPLKRK